MVASSVRLASAKGGLAMAVDEHRPYDWRGGTVELVCRLDRAQSAVEDLGSALEQGDDDLARLIAHSALNAVGSVVDAVNTLRAERPPEAGLSEPDAAGSMLAIAGSGDASTALEVMVNAMVALAATDDEEDADILIGACVDAASAYQVGASVLEDAPSGNGAAIQDLKRAFDVERKAAFGPSLTTGRALAVEINQRSGKSVLSDR